ncbi:CsbD family protein [Bradyrhizobium sp. 190]|uniref:CsbD family protein n=1 Tax=Bradyrhizobium sp. 190 TaxID=2782658 RepID=UPI001FF807EB|nr:CsbD family protein [Bradyrhizobium sp. 190]MCK1514110.1 CsbD family protein [Bradyrhizobium sp. 190]
MADLKDTATGKAKEIAGEILGDGNLAEEGKQQKDERHEEKDAEPGLFEGLRKLT